MKRFVYIFSFLRSIALAAAGAAVLGVWMPGAGAYVSEDWRSDSVMSVMDFQQIDAELGRQKTLVPGLESQWIICRNDPVNMIDPDGEWALPAIVTAIAQTGVAYANSKGLKSAAISATVGFVAGGLDTKDGNFKIGNAIKNAVASGVGGYITGFIGTIPGRKAESLGCAAGSATASMIYSGLNGENPLTEGKADLAGAVVIGQATGMINNEYSSAVATGLASTGSTTASNLIEVAKEFATDYKNKIDDAIEGVLPQAVENAYEEPMDEAE